MVDYPSNAPASTFGVTSSNYLLQSPTYAQMLAAAAPAPADNSSSYSAQLSSPAAGAAGARSTGSTSASAAPNPVTGTKGAVAVPGPKGFTPDAATAARMTTAGSARAAEGNAIGNTPHPAFNGQITLNDVNAIADTANRLGIQPAHLAAVIGLETNRTMDPDVIGGKGNAYRGLIQFGKDERAQYGYKPGMTFADQVRGPVYNYLSDPVRGLKPGMGLGELYSVINAGSLKNGAPRWGASDAPGQTVRTHVNDLNQSFLPQAEALYANDWQFNAGQPVPPGYVGNQPEAVAGGGPPVPGTRPYWTGDSRAANTSGAGAGAGYVGEGSPRTTATGEDARAYAYDAPARDVPTPRARPAPAGFDTGRFAAAEESPPNPRIRPDRPDMQGVVVKQGDTLWGIASRTLGDPQRWREIASANGILSEKGVRGLKPGTTLIIPGMTAGGPPDPRQRPDTSASAAYRGNQATERPQAISEGDFNQRFGGNAPPTGITAENFNERWGGQPSFTTPPGFQPWGADFADSPTGTARPGDVKAAGAGATAPPGGLATQEEWSRFRAELDARQHSPSGKIEDRRGYDPTTGFSRDQYNGDGIDSTRGPDVTFSPTRAQVIPWFEFFK